MTIAPAITSPVVVGSDGSPQSRQALAWAAQWAHTHDAPLSVVATLGAGPQTADTRPDERPAHAFCPVIVVPEGTRPTRTRQPVVLGFDRSRASLAAADFAVEQARRWQVPLIVLQVDEISHSHARVGPLGPGERTPEQQHGSAIFERRTDPGWSSNTATCVIDRPVP